MSTSVEKLFTSRDIRAAYPWITTETIHHRVSRGLLPVKHPSKGRGLPSQFTLPELVHCGVLDELASLGCYASLTKIASYYVDPQTLGNGRPILRIWKESPSPYYVDPSFYEKYGYAVIVEVQLRHDIVGASLSAKVHGHHLDQEAIVIERITNKEGRDRFYALIYAPEILHDEISFMDEQLGQWLDPQAKVKNRLHMTKGFVRVRQLYNRAVDALGLEYV